MRHPFFIQQTMNTTPATFLFSLSLNGCNVADIDFDRRGLLDESDSQDQAVALFFAQENPVNSLQRTSDRWDPLTTLRHWRMVIGVIWRQ